MGIVCRSGQYVIANEGGLFTCSNIKRYLDDQAYDEQILEVAELKYREYVCQGAKSTNPRVRFAEVPRSNPNPEPIGKAFVPRKARITEEELKEYGFTVGCPACERTQTGVGPRREHSTQCRDRIEAKMEENEKTKPKIDRARERMDHWTAKVGEEQLGAEMPAAAVADPEGGGGEMELLEPPTELFDIASRPGSVIYRPWYPTTT